MKRLLIPVSILVLCSCLAETSFALFGSHPEIDAKHIEKDLIGRQVRDWTFQESIPSRIKILDAKYDKDTAIVYISITTRDKKGKYGLEGKLRLEYEYAADDWNLLNIKAITFTEYSLARKIADSVIPELLTKSHRFVGKPLDITLSLHNEIQAMRAADFFERSGALVNVSGDTISFEGDLGQAVALLLHDARRILLGETHGVLSRYGYPRKDIVKMWGVAFIQMAKLLKEEQRIESFEFVYEVLTNAIQAAYNLVLPGSWEDVTWLKDVPKPAYRKETFQQRRQRIMKNIQQYAKHASGKSLREREHSVAYLMLEAKEGNVFFDHKTHTAHAGYGIACDDCHHEEQKDGSMSCSGEGCHGPNSVPKRADALHLNCKGCHQDCEIGPTECVDCHY